MIIRMFHLSAGSNKHYNRILNSARLSDTTFPAHFHERFCTVGEGLVCAAKQPLPMWSDVWGGVCGHHTSRPALPPQQPPSLPSITLSPQRKAVATAVGLARTPSVGGNMQVEEGEQEHLAGSWCSHISPVCLSHRITEHSDSEGPTRTIESSS